MLAKNISTYSTFRETLFSVGAYLPKIHWRLGGNCSTGDGLNFPSAHGGDGGVVIGITVVAAAAVAMARAMAKTM